MLQEHDFLDFVAFWDTLTRISIASDIFHASVSKF